ncbi:MAG: polysaccharide export protein [Thiohalocapsa sp.]|nr:polysaccharide export protein [Thiohalocapsa sp.]MCF7993491.1 polysaccharide export protein [Chromatiaceae bacterium]
MTTSAIPWCKRHVALIAVAAIAALFAGCGTPPKGAGQGAAPQDLAAEAQARSDEARLQNLNRQLAMAAVAQAPDPSRHDYRLGPDDVIKIEAPQAPEINGLKVRITGPGTATLPLVGEMQLGGLTTRDAENLLVERLGKYIHTPQVAIFVDEYASQEITVNGAVARPGVIKVQRPRTLFEVLSLAGGLKGNASTKVSVVTDLEQPETGQRGTRRFIVDLNDLVNESEVQSLVLGGGDSVFVHEAGIFFVDGAVAKPGSFGLKPDMTVLKAIAVAGGAKWEAKENQVRVIRRDGTGTPQEMMVDVAAVRDKRQPDMLLRDGDVVIVDTHEVRKNAVIVWNQAFRVLAVSRWYL